MCVSGSRIYQGHILDVVVGSWTRLGLGSRDCIVYLQRGYYLVSLLNYESLLENIWRYLGLGLRGSSVSVCPQRGHNFALLLNYKVY